MPKQMRNADLAQYRRAGILAKQPSTADKLTRFACQLLVLALVKSLRALSVPFGRLFAVYFFFGKNVYTLSVFLERQLLKIVGWLSGAAWPRDSKVARISHYYGGAPDVRRWHLGLAAVVIGSVLHAAVRGVQNQFDERVRRSRVLRRQMAHATSYQQWRALAEQLEKLEGEDAGMARKAIAQHEDYDRKLLQEKTQHLRKTRQGAVNVREAMMGLRVDLIRNIANIAKSQKHRTNFVSVPAPIQRYITEAQDQLQMVRDWPEVELPLEEKQTFFRITRHTYGRTALLLSGGGGLGTFHLGVCKALFERRMLPRILAGSSVGSIVSAVIGTKTDAELRDTFARLESVDIGIFQNSKTLDLVVHMIKMGHLQGMVHMVTKLRQLVGDWTFAEAYERSGRILNVTVCPADTNEPPRLLNYMTAPQALVWSAVAASSSFPGLYPPQNIVGRNTRGEHYKLHAYGGSDSLQRRWRDGSLEFDLPVQALGEMFNCNHFLVSQTNPHIVPLLNFKSLFPHKWASIMEAELKHRLQVVQWMLPEWRVSKYLTLFTQPWEGDITFTLPSALWNLSKTIMNPTQSDLMRAVRVGELACWERMAAIECNCTLEATLDTCLHQLQERHNLSSAQRRHSMTALGSKVPSWLHLPPLPTHLSSWGDNVAETDLSHVTSWGDFRAAAAAAAAAAAGSNTAHSGHLTPSAANSDADLHGGMGLHGGGHGGRHGGATRSSPSQRPGLGNNLYRSSYSHTDLLLDSATLNHHNNLLMAANASNSHSQGGGPPSPAALLQQQHHHLTQGVAAAAGGHGQDSSGVQGGPGGLGGLGSAPHHTHVHDYLPPASAPPHSSGLPSCDHLRSVGRLPPIPSSRSSLEDEAGSAFDSASSVAVGGVPGANGGAASSSTGLHSRLRSSSSRPGSAGISRRGSCISGLHALAGPEHDDLVLGGQAGGPLPRRSASSSGKQLTSSAPGPAAELQGSLSGSVSDPAQGTSASSSGCPTPATGGSSLRSSLSLMRSAQASPPCGVGPGHRAAAMDLNAGRGLAGGPRHPNLEQGQSQGKHTTPAGGATPAPGGAVPLGPEAPPASLTAPNPTQLPGSFPPAAPLPPDLAPPPTHTSSTTPNTFAASVCGSASSSVASFLFGRGASLPASTSTATPQGSHDEVDVIALAQMDCTDTSVDKGDFWGALLPLANRVERLAAAHAVASSGQAPPYGGVTVALDASEEQDVCAY